MELHIVKLRQGHIRNPVKALIHSFIYTYVKQLKQEVQLEFLPLYSHTLFPAL